MIFKTIMTFVRKRAVKINKSKQNATVWSKSVKPPLHCYLYGTPKWKEYANRGNGDLSIVRRRAVLLAQNSKVVDSDEWQHSVGDGEPNYCGKHDVCYQYGYPKYPINTMKH